MSVLVLWLKPENHLPLCSSPDAQVHSGLIAGVPVLLLKPENHFFLGGRIYGGSYNELEAYLFFSRACLEYLQVLRRYEASVTCVSSEPAWGTSRR